VVQTGESDKAQLLVRRKRGVGRIWCVAAFVAVGLGLGAGCGPNVSQPIASGGAAGKAGAGTSNCSPGDTRLCVGVGACAGGQRCADNGEWLACECGSAGAGATSVAGAGGSLPSSVAGASGLGGAAQSGTGGFSSDAGDDAGGSAGQSDMVADEPCPVGGVAIDCSGQCAAKAAACSQTCSTPLLFATVTSGEVIGRLPSHPGTLCTCKQGLAPTAFSASVGLELGSSSGKFHLVVPPPWHTSDFPLSPTCSVKEAQCGSVQAGDLGGFGIQDVVVWTADPNAPAINLVAVAGPCP
jgi:hypothetical protein